ncbi:PadR family transcriptional regulator [Paenibacillus sp. Z3-2]
MGSTELLKGNTETILLSLLRKQDRYGYEIALEIERLSEGFLRFNEGTLYPALKRLERQGWVRSYWVDSKDGPRRKYYTLTDLGTQQFSMKAIEWEKFQTVMNRFIGDRHAQI